MNVGCDSEDLMPMPSSFKGLEFWNPQEAELHKSFALTRCFNINVEQPTKIKRWVIFKFTWFRLFN